MKKYYGYIRVSTVRQGEKGTSLAEQKAAIEIYCKREGIAIGEWFEELQTAAKTGRTVFLKMLRNIQIKGVAGLVLHKIDRGARNLKDWAELSQLVDSGVDVRIAGDSVDLNSRGGRLSGDILAVVAADFIRNLRDEVKKGQRGRLKQGLYPFFAPIGYLNTGPGGVKVIDPFRGPFVREAFALYATGGYSIRMLRQELIRRGFVTRSGRQPTINDVHVLLGRSFYYGRIEVNGESFIGVHEPIVSKALFDRAQAVLRGRSRRINRGGRRYLLQRMLLCKTCSRFLYAETQKGHVYYRCQSTTCKGTCIRESYVAANVARDVAEMQISEHLMATFKGLFDIAASDKRMGDQGRNLGAAQRLAEIETRHKRLVDAYLEGALDRKEYDERKGMLVDERIKLNELTGARADQATNFASRQDRFLELLSALHRLENMEDFAEKRLTVIDAVSNFVVDRKTVVISWKQPLRMLLGRPGVLTCWEYGDTSRTSEAATEAILDREHLTKVVDCVLKEECL